MKPEVRLIDERDGAPAEEPELAPDDVAVGFEVPEADAVEQYRPADPAERADDSAELPAEADPADAVDQRRAVPGEDDYE